MNFGNCCIRARKAHTSIRKFSKENLTVKVSGVIVDAHLIPMKFRTESRACIKSAPSIGLGETIQKLQFLDSPIEEAFL